MLEVDIGELTQNAPALVAQAAHGETVTIVDRGRPVAQLTGIPSSRLQALLEAGRGRRARRNLAELPAPEEAPDLSGELAAMRDEERY